MNQFRRLRKNKAVTKKKINKIKSATLKMSLIMLNFVFATFAWFTYTMVLDNTVDVNVSAWQIDFDDGWVLGKDMSFSVGKFYPGMGDDNYAKSIEIVNLGDRAANIEYDIKELKILGKKYEIKKEAVAGDDEDTTLYVGENIDTESGIKTIKLLNNSSKFPFEIQITHSIQIDIETPYDENQNKGFFEIRFIWPYEIATLPEILPNDLPEELTEEEKLEELNLRKTLLDTKWGYDIATFYDGQENLEEDEQKQGIEITLQVIAKQNLD